MNHKIKILALAILATAITACSNDDDYTTVPLPDNATLISFGMNNGGWNDGRPETRAASTADVPGCDVIQPHSIGVWGYYMTAGAFTPDTYTGENAISDINDPVANDYKVWDVRKNTSTYSDKYEYLANHLFPHDKDNAAHQDPSTAFMNYSQGTDGVKDPTGGFPWENQKYMFYCYAPHEDEIEENVGTLYKMTASLDNASIAMSKIILLNVPSISNRDIVVAKQRREWRRLADPNDTQYSGPTGSCVDFTAEGYELQHLYAAVQFCFALSEEYAEQRYLHIKKVTITTDESVRTDGGENINPTYTVTKDITSPDSPLEWSSASLNTGISPLAVVIGEWDTERQFILGTGYDPATEDLLAGTAYPYPQLRNTERYYPFGNLYLVPQNNKERKLNAGGTGFVETAQAKKFNISVTYDVYDHKGQITRLNATANSVLTFPLSGDKAVTDFKPGYYYNAYIKINPDFLYVLSDNDAISDIIITGGK